MIPRIQTGASFKGAGLYYLHDKRLEGEDERLTAERVAWTYAINTLENDPEAALAEMRRTAFDQPLLKRLAGKRGDGRPTEKTVMTVALAWSPDQSPTKNDMIEAGHSFLQHMGWEAHQVLFVSHNDTKHPHVHLIINRVHPETGMTLDDGWAKIRAQKWALSYERENGHIYCEAREAKYGRDENRDSAPQLTHREWKLWQEVSKANAVDPDYRRELESGEWDALKSNQREGRDRFWKETAALHKQLRAALREEVRKEFSKDWSDYAKIRAARDKEAKVYDREARRAIRELRRTGNTRKVVTELIKGPNGRTYRKRRSIESPAIEQIKKRQNAYHERKREDLWEVRKNILARQKDRLEGLAEPAHKQLSVERADGYKTLLADQRGQKAELRDDQAEMIRRRDLLQGPQREVFKASSLTPEQLAAYLQQSRRTAAEATDRALAGRETTVRTTARAVDAAKSAKEITDRGTVKSDKDQAREAKRQADVDYYLQKRADDRARDRGGGRDR